MATPCSEMTIDLETGSVGIGVFTSLHLPDTNAPIKGINRFERHSIGDVADALVTNYADADCVIYWFYLYGINSCSNLGNMTQSVGVASHERESPILVIADSYRIARFDRIFMVKSPNMWKLGSA